MREQIRDKERLGHILEHIDNAISFMEGKNIDNLISDKILYYAVVKCLEVIGEAAYMITTEFKDNHPQIPWQSIIRMRHLLVHGYFHINPAQVVETIENDLPTLRPQIESYINELD